MKPADHLPADRPEVDLTLFVACYNEEKNIRGTLETLRQALSEFAFTWEIIVIDDCSTDRSAEVVREFITENPKLPVYLKVNESNRGLGYNFTE